MAPTALTRQASWISYHTPPSKFPAVTEGDSGCKSPSVGLGGRSLKPSLLILLGESALSLPALLSQKRSSEEVGLTLLVSRAVIHARDPITPSHCPSHPSWPTDPRPFRADAPHLGAATEFTQPAPSPPVSGPSALFCSWPSDFSTY